MRIFGSPPAKSVQLISNRAEFNTALRNNDQKLMLGLSDLGDDGAQGISSFAGLMGFSGLIPGVQTNRFGGYSDYLTCGTKKVWASARCIDIIGGVLASTETQLINRDPKKKKKAVRPDPALMTLLQNPNPFETIYEFLYLWTGHIKFTGNSFWLKDEMNGRYQPKAIYALNPRLMRIIPNKELRVDHYSYRINQKEIKFDPDEIVHFRKPHANDFLWGLGDIESGESLFDEFINQSLYSVRMMANGAFPSSVLVKKDTQNFDQAKWELMTEGLRAKYSGVRNTGKTMYLNGEWNVLRLGLDSKELRDLEKNAKNVEDIFVHHGVPLSVAGYTNKTNFATARQEDITFRKYTCLPLMNLYTDVMNSDRGFICAFNPELKLDFSLAGLVDVEQVMKENRPLFECGAISSNDLREQAGLDRLDDPFLDQHFVLNTMVPIEIAGITQLGDSNLQLDAQGNPLDPRAQLTQQPDAQAPGKPAVDADGNPIKPLDNGNPPSDLNKPGRGSGTQNTADGIAPASQSSDSVNPGKRFRARGVR